MEAWLLIILMSKSDLSFKTDMKPIFQQRCYSCHQSGYWDWTKYDNAFKYKDKIRWRVWETRTMPLGGNITEDERKKIRDWVDQGAKP